MPPAEQVSQVQTAGRQVLVDWADGRRSAFHAIWLRDNCSCPECRHPSGQRLLDTTTIPADIAPRSVGTQPGDAIEVVWANDAHRSTYTPAWLRADSYADEDRDSLRSKLAVLNRSLSSQPT